MSQFGWTNCPSDIYAQIDTLLTHLAVMLGDNLVGIYLHGSLALGCFNPEQSDIDLLVVTGYAIPVEMKRDIVELLLRSSLAPNPIEISSLVAPGLHPFRHPLPYDLHYSESWRERYTEALANGSWLAWNDESRSDYDLAAHLTIARVHGICLYGKPAREVFPVVPPPSYDNAILRDFDESLQAREQKPIYLVLNACRVLAYLREGHIFSKDEGGSWGLQALPTEQRDIVAWALDMYRGTRAFATIDHAALSRFARLMEQEIHNLRPGAPV